MPSIIPVSVPFTTRDQGYDPPYYTVTPTTGQFIFIIIVFVLCCGMLAWRFADWWQVQPVRPTLSHLRFRPWRLRRNRGLQLQPLPPPLGRPTLPPYAPPGNGGNGDGRTGGRDGQGSENEGGGNAGQGAGGADGGHEGIELQILNTDRRRSRTPSHNSGSSHAMLNSSNDGQHREVTTVGSETTAERAYHLAIADHISNLENSFSDGTAMNRAKSPGPPETVLRVHSSDSSAGHGPVTTSNTTLNITHPGTIWRTSPAIDLAIDPEAERRKETKRKAYEWIAGRFPSSASVRTAQELDRRAEAFKLQATVRDGSTSRKSDFKTIVLPVPSTARGETTPARQIGRALSSPSALPRPIAKTESNSTKSKVEIESGDGSEGGNLASMLPDGMSMARRNGRGPLTMDEIQEGLKKALGLRSHDY